MKLKTVTLRGYKSIAKLGAFELRNLNVLIGANGATDYLNDDRTSCPHFGHPHSRSDDDGDNQEMQNLQMGNRIYLKRRSLP